MVIVHHGMNYVRIDLSAYRSDQRVNASNAIHATFKRNLEDVATLFAPLYVEYKRGEPIVFLYNNGFITFAAEEPAARPAVRSWNKLLALELKATIFGSYISNIKLCHIFNILDNTVTGDQLRVAWKRVLKKRRASAAWEHEQSATPWKTLCVEGNASLDKPEVATAPSEEQLQQQIDDEGGKEGPEADRAATIAAEQGRSIVQTPAAEGGAAGPIRAAREAPQGNNKMMASNKFDNHVYMCCFSS